MLKIENIHISYNGRSILLGACFQAPNFGICAIYGESGSGKTSLLNSILLEEHQFDHYSFNGKVISDADDFRKKYIASLSQSSTLIDELSIENHFDLFTHEQRKASLIQQLNLKSLLKKYPPQLSGGEKTRVGFALALLKNQPILILDEPTASLDSEIASVIYQLILDYSKEHLVIISTHDQQFLKFANCIYFIENKQLKLVKYEEVKGDKIKLFKHNLGLKKTIDLYINLKKKRKFYHLLMMMLIILSTTFTSFGMSKLIFPSKSSDYALTDIYDNDIFIYKPIHDQLVTYYSQKGNEFPFSEYEIQEIKSLEHVIDVQENYNINITRELLLPEEENQFNSYTQSSISILNESKHEILNDVFPKGVYDIGHGITLSVYYENKDYSSDIEIQTSLTNGIYISDGLYQQLNIEIDENSELYLKMNINVPVFNAYNDAYMIVNQEQIQTTDDEGNQTITNVGGERVEMSRTLGAIHEITLPISGVLKNEKMGVNTGQPTAIFIPFNKLDDLLNMYLETDKVYYQLNINHNFERVDEINGTSNVMYCEPYQPISLIVTVDDSTAKKDVINQLDQLGYSSLSTISNELNTHFQNNSEENIFYASMGSLFVVSFVYFIITYLNSIKEKQITTFFIQSGYSHKVVRHLMVGKYGFDFILLSLISVLFSLIYLYFINPLFIQWIGTPLISTSSYLYIIIIIILNFIINFLFPILLKRK